MDYQKLSELTDGFSSADIELIVEKAGRLGFKKKQDIITMQLLEEAIAQSKPSVTLEQRKKYEKIKAKMKGVEPEEQPRRKIGF